MASQSSANRRPSRVGVGGDEVVVFAAVGIGRQALAAVFDPAQGHAKLAAGPGERHFFRQQDPLIAKAAADIGSNHADLAFVDAEALRQAGAHNVRLLGGAVVHLELAQARIPMGEHGAPL